MKKILFLSALLTVAFAAQAQLKIAPKMQKGDVTTTWADTSALEKDFGYCPKVGIEEGVASFVKWYRDFYGC